MPAIIRAEQVTKSFGEVHALKGVDLEVEKGTVLGLLGPNGAGKTTMVRILATLLLPTGGRAEVDGFDVVKDAEELRFRIGLAGQSAAVDENLTGLENLQLVGRLYHLEKGLAKQRAVEVLERFDLADAADRRHEDLLRRHAPQARPRRQPRRPPRRALPGRAHHGTRPSQPDRRVGLHP